MIKNLVLTFCLLTLTFQSAQADPDLEGTLPKWRRLIASAVKESGVPGCSVAVVYKGEVVMLEGFGITNVDKPSPVTPDTVFQLASCSKPIATTCVAALVGEKKLTFDTRIQGLDPDFALYDPWVTAHITVRDLCSHRSGLPGQAGNELEELGFDQAAILRALRYLPLENRFRDSYSYSNFGITAGVEAATDGQFQQVVQDKIFTPLGMTSSSARYEDYARRPDRAMAHILEKGKAYQRYERKPDAQAPAAGVSSTARDLTRFLLLHLGKGKVDGRQIVAAEALQETYLPVMRTGFNPATFSTGFYALGWAVAYDRHGRTEIKHSGAFSTGSRSQIVLIPEAELGIAILSNAFPSGLPEALSQGLIDLLLDGSEADLKSVMALNDLVGNGMAGMVAESLALSSRPATARAARPPASYEGSYANDYFGPARIAGMNLEFGANFAVSAPLQPWDGDTFFLQADLSDGPLVTLVKFDADLNGFTLDGLDDWDTGHFKRVK